MSNLATIVNNILADSGIDDINVVVTTGSYTNPAWIVSLPWTKITGTPTTLAGYGITDAYTQTQVNNLLNAYVPYTGATTNVNLGVNSLTATGITVSKSAGVSTITFPAGTNDPAFISHTESTANVGIMRFSVGDDNDTVDYFAFGNLNNPDAFRINSNGTVSTGVWQGSAIADTYISSAATWNAKQNAITLTTTGTSGAATLIGATLNIPDYGGALGAYLPLAGGTMTGNINWAQTDRGLTWGFNTDGAYIKFYNTSDGDTDSRLEFATIDNNNEYFRWGHVPSGGSFYESMRLVPNSSGNAQLIVSGNLGLGVTPSAWTINPAFQIKDGGSLWALNNQNLFLSQNVYFDGSFKYIASVPVSSYQQSSGAHLWLTAPSGTAGNAISFTQAMTLTASSKLLVNTTADSGNYFIQANGNIASINSSAAGLFTVSGTRSIGIQSFGGDWNYISSNGNPLVIRTQDANTLYIRTSDVDRLTIIPSGNVGIGTVSPIARLTVVGTGSYNVFNETLPSDAVIWSSEMTNDQYNSILQLVSVRQSLTTGSASNGFLGFSTVDDSNAQGVRDAGRIAIVNESPSARNSATALGFWTNSGGTNTNPATEKVRITSGGNFLIGNTSVSAINERLNVTGNGIAIEASDAGSTMLIGNFGGADGIVGTFTNDNLQIRTNNVARLTIANSGAATLSNLAGTGTRIVVADVNGTLSASSALSGYVPYSGATATVNLNSQELQARQIAVTTNLGAGSFASPLFTDINFLGFNNQVRARIRSWSVDSNSVEGILTFWTNTNLNSFAERMRITSGGNVGIATDNPSKLLSVRSLTNDVTTFAGFYALNETQGVELWYGGIQMGGTNPNVILNLSSKGSESIIFNTNSTQRMRITGGGDVGIGNWSTNTPQDRLHVNGAIQVGFVDALNNALRIFWNGASSYGAIQTSSSSNLALNPSGNNVLIGTVTDNGNRLRVNGKIWADGNITYWVGFSSYTPDGLFSASADPGRIYTPSGGDRILFGYFDQGGGQYWGRIGFKGNTNWSLGTGAGGHSFVIGVGNGSSGNLVIDNAGAATFSSSVTAVGLSSTTSAAGNLNTRIRNNVTSASGSTGYGLAIESEASAATSYALTVRNLAESNTYFHISTETSRVGFVGIGTNVPAALLDVMGGGQQRIRITSIADGSNANPEGSSLVFRSGSGLVETARIASLNRFQNANGSSLGFFVTDNSNVLQERIHINALGNVGIGASSPSFRLQVNGSEAGLYVIGASVAPFTQTIATFVYGGNGNSINIENNGGKASIQARVSSAVMDLLLNPAGGNVGIRNASPVTYLDVAGIADQADFSSLLIRAGNSDSASPLSNQILLGYAGTNQYAHAIKTRHQSGGQAGNSIEFWVWRHGDSLDTPARQRVMAAEGNGVRIANSSGTLISPVGGSILTVNGVGYFSSSVTASSFFEISDSRLKTLLDDKIDYSSISSVKPKYYEKNGRTELGYFAQDFELLLPSAVSKNEDGYLNLSYREVHTAKIAALEQEIAELKKQLKNK
jgi:hypothetical protein